MRIAPVVVLVVLLAPLSMATTLTVTTTSDSGAGSLRQAILDANANPGADRIVFSVAGVTTPSIAVASLLPQITDALEIDGTANGAAVPGVEITLAPGAASIDGIRIDASNVTIRGCVINRFRYGIIVQPTTERSSLVFESNYIGTDTSGARSLGNAEGILVYLDVDGLRISRNVIAGNLTADVFVIGVTNLTIDANSIGVGANGASIGPMGGIGLHVEGSSGVIGGDTAQAGNVIGSKDAGIYLYHPLGMKVAGNFIGADRAGSARPNGKGIDVEASGELTIDRNVIAGNTGVGINVKRSGLRSLVITGNKIGVTADASSVLKNGGDGISISTPDLSVHEMSIGGSDPVQRNIISGNAGWGVNVVAFGVFNHIAIKGNFVGTDGSGAVAIGNAKGGIRVSDGVPTIGGAGVGEGNVVSGNSGPGIDISTPASSVLLGNVVGLDARRMSPLPNTGDGIRLLFGHAVLGGTAPGEANTVAYNGGAGIMISGYGRDNRVTGNSITSNSGLGIDLYPLGVTPNDAGDADSGANGLQNFPEFVSVTSSSSGVRITGVLDSNPNTAFTIDFYSSQEGDRSEYGEGTKYVTFTSVTTDANGHASFDVVLPVAVAATTITSTATSPTGSTSEFSKAILAGPVPVPAPAFSPLMLIIVGITLAVVSMLKMRV